MYFLPYKSVSVKINDIKPILNYIHCKILSMETEKREHSVTSFMWQVIKNWGRNLLTITGCILRGSDLSFLKSVILIFVS